MVRREVLVSAGGYQWRDSQVAEDYELWCRLARRGVRFANLAEPLLSYRLHAQQAKATQVHTTIRSVLAIKEKFWRRDMGLISVLRLWAEKSLLHLPPWMVWRLISVAQYRDHIPPQFNPWLVKRGDDRIPAASQPEYASVPALCPALYQSEQA
jgi:hypothetical protein